MGALEIGRLGVKAGLNFTDDSTPEGTAVNSILHTVLRQPGVKTAYWGHEVENPCHLWLFMDWDSVEDHRNWQKHPDYAEVNQALTPYIDPSVGPGFLKHLTVDPFPVAVLDPANAGVVELLAAYFPRDIGEEDKAKLSAIFRDFVAKALRGASDFKGASLGWGVETDFPLPGGESEDGFAAHYGLIGWASIEAHLKFRETDAFKENIDMLRNLPGLVKTAMVHVRCKTAKA